MHGTQELEISHIPASTNPSIPTRRGTPSTSGSRGVTYLCAHGRDHVQAPIQQYQRVNAISTWAGRESAC